MKLAKLLLATLGATTLFGALAGGAAARTFSASSQTLRATFYLFLPHEERREPEQREQLEITGTFGTYRCVLTLEGSFHARTLSKVASSLIGYINRAEMAECSAFPSRVLRETLPWHVVYRSFTGLLPSISSLSVSIIGFAMQIREPLATCLGTTTAEAPFILTFPLGGSTLTAAEVSGTLTTRCPGGAEVRVNFGGRTRALRGGLTAPNITLI